MYRAHFCGWSCLKCLSLLQLCRFDIEGDISSSRGICRCMWGFDVCALTGPCMCSQAIKSSSARRWCPAQTLQTGGRGLHQTAPLHHPPAARTTQTAGGTGCAAFLELIAPSDGVPSTCTRTRSVECVCCQRRMSQSQLPLGSPSRQKCLYEFGCWTLSQSRSFPA